ncbi:MAG: hypothetical protein Q4F85_13580 [Prevotella sp.]|nr:hypothetical protein [Prevotella sp.]
MVDIHDYNIRLIEEEIMMKYGRPPHYNPNYDYLLSLRKDMINKRVSAHKSAVDK